MRSQGAETRESRSLHALFQAGSYRKQIPIKYRAMEIGNEFIVGYGLDYDQLGRSLKDIYVVTE